MKKPTLCLLVLVIFSYPKPVTAMNSLVTAEGIGKMKAADINGKVIAVLAAEQTCTVNPDLLVRLKKAGVKTQALKQIITADRCRQHQTATLSTKDIEVLKKAGCSEGMIMRLLGVTAVKTVVDEQGNENVIYDTHTLPSPEGPVDSGKPDAFYINIEKLEAE